VAEIYCDGIKHEQALSLAHKPINAMLMYMGIITPSIGTPVDRLVLIGRELCSLQETLQRGQLQKERDQFQDIDSTRAEIESRLKAIEHIIDISFGAEEPAAEPIWKKNFTRLGVAHECLELEQNMMTFRACINAWVRRILESDLTQISGLQLSVDRDYFADHRIPQNVNLSGFSVEDEKNVVA
jgi:hypothetical protein